MKNNKKKLIVTAVAAGLLACSYAGSADAGVFVSIGAPVVPVPYYMAPPVAYAPLPVPYVVPAPVPVAAVVAVPSYPVYGYYGGYHYHYDHHWRHWDGHGRWH